MLRNQIILSLAALTLLLGLYFGGQRHKKGGEQGQVNMVRGGATANATVPEFAFQPYADSLILRLSVADRKKWEELSATHSQPDTQLLKQQARFWETQQQATLAGYYFKKAAFLENTEKSLTFAGNLFLAVLQKTEQPDLRHWQALQAIACYEKVLTLNRNNPDVQVALATCYTEGTGETMKGVMLLREVTQKDSNHIAGNLLLGKLAIQSGQYDKAIKRLEKVLKLKEGDTEALYFLAEAYKGSGNKSKAIELFELCKKKVNRPEFSREIDQYINSFK